MGLGNQQVSLQLGVELLHRVALLFEQLGAQLLDRHDAQLLRDRLHKLRQPRTRGPDARFRIRQHQNFAGALAYQISRLDGQCGGLAGAGQCANQHRAGAGLEYLGLLQRRVDSFEAGIGTQIKGLHAGAFCE